MNPNTPFSGQQTGVFQAPSRTTSGMFQTQPPFQFDQLPLFGQNSGGLVKNPGFAHSSDFTVASGLHGSSSGQTLGFEQPSGFAQPYSLGHTAAFVTPSAPASSSSASKQGFSFKPPTNLGSSQSTLNFGAASGETSGSGIVGSDFRFKTPENAVFKPIFGSGSNLEQTQSQLTSTPFTFSYPGGSGPGRLGPFGLLQETSSSNANTEFSFSKPVTGNSSASSFTASLPSKSTEDDKKRPMLFFASPSSSFTALSNSSAGPLPLGDSFQLSKTSKPEHKELLTQEELQPAVGKGTKRKEKEHSPRRSDYDALDEPELLLRAESATNKRPVRLSRPRIGGLFNRTLRDVLKSNKDSMRSKTKVEPGEAEQTSVAMGSRSVIAMSRAAAAAAAAAAPLTEDDSKGKVKQDSAVSNPLRRTRSSSSTDSLGGLPLTELTAFQCKNIPKFLNDRSVLEKHFKQFVKIQRIRTNRNKSLAIVFCFDHASAVLARKKAKDLHSDIVTFWHKKKPSPNKQDYPYQEHKADESEGRQSTEQPSLPQLCKPVVRSPASGNTSSKSSPAKNASLKKSLQFDTNAFESGSEGTSSENSEASASSLSNLIGMIAETSEDKYRLLDQRDKIMRQARVKRTDLGKAKTFVGTCPDMCPEKERYMRETRNQLSVFELFPGTDKVNHAAAIKEYSRSSADQEEPLPHELRPSEVLNMTMDYLITQIMDKGEGCYREWYDFVWNRTRGIRKDITQQHLCGPLTVSLIEKCTRFHIHCSHHLCEEAMSSFDAKINNENMTKCLQSLKEMYQDLANKGVYCKNEAEFRGYNVLLNLNRGDILREVQRFHPAVRNSAEVRFAVQAFAALNSNNFVRFFKLVQMSSYLNACLLHCYFSQIRRDALRALNVAYTINTQRPTIFPLDNVIRMLLFRGSEDATDFINYYGLNVSDGFVELNRSASLEPESLPKPKKSPFVRQKLTVSVGEIINGGPLPLMTHHVPMCSFNGQNKYTGESATVDAASSGQKTSLDFPEKRAGGTGLDSEGLQALPPPLLSSLPPAPLLPAAVSTFQPLAPPPPPPPKPQPAYDDMDIAEVVEDLVSDVLEGECREISNAGAAYLHSAIWVSNATVDELMTGAVLEMSRQIASDEISAERERLEEEKRQAEEERRKKAREQLINTLSQSLGLELLQEVVNEDVGEISKKELKSAVEKDQRVRIARCSKEVCAEIMGVFLEDEVFQSAKETLQELQCFCKYLQRWRDAVAARKKLKRQMRAFPAAPCCVDPENRLKALSPSAECPIARGNLAKRIVNLGQAGNLGTSCLRLGWLRNKTIHQMKVQHFYQQLLCKAAWTPLDLPSLVAETFPGQQGKVFWKVLLVLPSYEDYSAEDPGRVLADWLKVKFMIDENGTSPTAVVKNGIQTLALQTSLQGQGSQATYVSVCVKVTHGTLSPSELDHLESQRGLLGTSGLVLLLPPRVRSNDAAEEDVYWLSALLQLKRLLQVKPFQPIVPLVVLVPSHGERVIEKVVEEGLMLPDLISANLISDYLVVELLDSVNDLQGTSKLSEAVRWLIAQGPGALRLGCQTLMQYIEDGIDREFSHQFSQDQKERRLAGLPSQDPSAIIELYNSVIQFLAEVASSEEFSELSWPVTEFVETGGSSALPHLQWNLPSHLAWLKKAILAFQIPQMDLPPLGAPWHLVCAMIFQYVSQTASSLQTQQILKSQVENLLSKIYYQWKARRSAYSGECGPSVEEIPWDSILALCINHKLRDWKPPRLPVAPEAVSKDGQIHVYFVEKHLSQFTRPFLWEEARLNTQRQVQQSQGRTKRKSQPFGRPYSRSLSPTEYGTSQGSVSDKEETVFSGADFTRTVSRVDLLPEHLSAKLKLEKIESQRFDQQLQELLVKDSELFQSSPPLPLYLPESLVSVPQIIPPLAKTSASQSPEAGIWTELKETDARLSHRLVYLKQLIEGSKEEETACELHLSNLLDMIDA